MDYRGVPKRISITGSHSKGMEHTGEAESLLQICKEAAAFQGLMQYTMTRQLPDGTLMQAWVAGAISGVRIWPPEEAKHVPEELDIVQMPPGDMPFIIITCSDHRIRVLTLDGYLVGIQERAPEGTGEFSYPYQISCSKEGDPHVMHLTGAYGQSEFNRISKLLSPLKGFSNDKFRWNVAMDSAFGRLESGAHTSSVAYAGSKYNEDVEFTVQFAEVRGESGEVARRINYLIDETDYKIKDIMAKTAKSRTGFSFEYPYDDAPEDHPPASEDMRFQERTVNVAAQRKMSSGATVSTLGWPWYDQVYYVMYTEEPAIRPYAACIGHDGFLYVYSFFFFSNYWTKTVWQSDPGAMPDFLPALWEYEAWYQWYWGHGEHEGKMRYNSKHYHVVYKINSAGEVVDHVMLFDAPGHGWVRRGNNALYPGWGRTVAHKDGLIVGHEIYTHLHEVPNKIPWQNYYGMSVVAHRLHTLSDVQPFHYAMHKVKTSDFSYEWSIDFGANKFARRICTNAQGNIFVLLHGYEKTGTYPGDRELADFHHIACFDKDGVNYFAFSFAGAYPMDITVDNQGHVYVLFQAAPTEENHMVMNVVKVLIAQNEETQEWSAAIGWQRNFGIGVAPMQLDSYFPPEGDE